MKIQKESMEKQMKYMMQSLKPTFITFLPIILIFGWLNAHLAFQPVMPGEAFEVGVLMQEGTTGAVMLSVTPSEGITFISNETQELENNAAVWELSGDAGEYLLEYTYEDVSVQQSLLITEEQAYEEPQVMPEKEPFSVLQVKHEKIILFNLFGWGVGWLAGYIIFIMILSTGLRKLFKVY
jgi:hypothetical protein